MGQQKGTLYTGLTKQGGKLYFKGGIRKKI